MDTKEKRREQPRQRPSQPEEPVKKRRPAGEEPAKKRRPSPEAEAPARKRRPAAEEAPAKKRRPAAEEAPARKRRPAAEEAPAKKRRPAAEEASAKKRRPAEEEAPRRLRPAGQSAQRRRPAEHQEQPAHRRKVQDDGIPFSAPKGTGPRKSAPKMTLQEAEALRARQQSSAKEQPQPEKKSALQNFIAGVRGETDVPQNAAERAARRRKERAAEAEKKKQNALRHDTPAIIYTEPKVFSRDRLLLQLLTVTAVVAALIIGMSVFFKVENITVSGADTYSAESIVEASGIRKGDNLLTFSKAGASARIQAKMDYVDNIRIGIKLPDTVIIYVEELSVAYAIESSKGDLWLINSDGKVVRQITTAQLNDYTQIEGVTLSDPAVGKAAVAADEVPEETLESGEPVPITVTGAQRLSSVLQILKALEANDIVGEAASVNVAELEDVRLWYGNQYEVLLGDTARMEYKIACMNDAISQMSDYQSGILDVSFTTWADMVGYTPFG